MLRLRTLSLATLVLSASATLASAQIPGSFSPTPSSSITLMAQKNESFAMTLSSTVQTTALSIADSTAAASQGFTGSVVLTPSWDLANNRVVTMYAYVSSGFTSGTASIASSYLEASASGGTGSASGAWSAFSSTVDGHANAVSLSSLTATGTKKKVTDNSEAVTVGFRLSTANLYVEPGTYTGVVTFAARVQ